MNPLEQALDVATRMRDALQTELAEARQQRIMIRELDVQGLFERARQRGEFNVKLAQLQDALGRALQEGAAALGVERLTTDLLSTYSGNLEKNLVQALSELRASAQALQEIDNMNQIVAKRALTCVRGFVSALSPQASAYNRYGGMQEQRPGTIARQVA